MGALFILGLVLSSTFTSCLAGRIGIQREQVLQQQPSPESGGKVPEAAHMRAELNRLDWHSQPQRHQQQIIAQERQADSGGLITTIIQLGLKYGPTLFNAVFGGAEGAQTPAGDKIDELEIKEEDPLSTSNLIAMAIKVALALFSSATSDGIDKSDVAPSPVESIMGIVISALTGSENPSEVAQMAKQASEVVNMVISLVEALQTSFSSS